MEIHILIKHFWLELCKYDVGKYSRKYGSSRAKTRKAEEESVITQNTYLVQKPVESLSEEDKPDLCKLQNKLDDMYKQKKP